VQAFDAAGNKSGKSEITVSTKTPADNIAPTMPTNLVATPSETSIALSWSASTDNVDVAGYTICLDGDLIETVSQTNFNITGLSSDTDYTLAVQAFDAAGNKSAKAEITTSTNQTIDDEAPTAPTNLAAEASETSIALSWTASTDNIGVIGYIIYLDGDSIETVFQTNFNITGLLSGTKYPLAVQAFDAASNKSAKAEITTSTNQTIDDEAPTALTNLVAVPSDTTIAFSWAASTDNVGIVGYIIYLGGDSIDIVTETNFTLIELSPGTEYIFSVEAVDAAGNKSEKATVTQSTIITGIESVKESELLVYPNPFSSFVIIESAKKQEVIIYDVSGKIVLKTSVEAGTNRINTSEIKKGVYLMKCGADTFKLIK
jgi:chitodextrinase